MAAERLEVAHSHLWPRPLDAYGLARRVVPLSAEALDLVVTGYATPGEDGLRGVETRMEALLCRAIAQGAPVRRVWIVPEFVAERLGPRPEGVVQRRAVGFGPARMVSEPESKGGVNAVSGLRLPKPRLRDRAPVPVFRERRGQGRPTRGVRRPASVRPSVLTGSPHCPIVP